MLRNSTPHPIVGVLSEVDDLLADDLFDSWLELENDEDFEGTDDGIDQPEDYFEDYFEDYLDSLNDPQNPHLEP